MSSALVPCQDFNSLPSLSSQGAYCPYSHTSPDRLTCRGTCPFSNNIGFVETTPLAKLTSASLLLSFLHSFLSPSLFAQLLSAIFVSDEDTDNEFT